MIFAVILYVVCGLEFAGGVVALIAMDASAIGVIYASTFFVGAFKDLALGYLLDTTTETRKILLKKRSNLSS